MLGWIKNQMFMESEARQSISARLKSPPVASASAYGLAVSAPQFFIKGLQRGDFTVVHRPQRVNAQQFVTLIEQGAPLWLPSSAVNGGRGAVDMVLPSA